MDYSPNPCPTTQFAVVDNGNWLIEGQRKIPQRDYLSLCIFWYPTPYTFFGNIIHHSLSIPKQETLFSTKNLEFRLAFRLVCGGSMVCLSEDQTVPPCYRQSKFNSGFQDSISNIQSVVKHIKLCRTKLLNISVLAETLKKSQFTQDPQSLVQDTLCLIIGTYYLLLFMSTSSPQIT